MITKLKQWIFNLKTNLYTLYLVYFTLEKHIFTKLLIIITISYALSPIDLIPDFIPILGYLDDLILIPIGIYFSIKLIPIEIWKECKLKSKNSNFKDLPKSKSAVIVIILIWIFSLYFVSKIFI